MTVEEKMGGEGVKGVCVRWEALHLLSR